VHDWSAADNVMATENRHHGSAHTTVSAFAAHTLP
jgi:hypothetical protein